MGLGAEATSPKCRADASGHPPAAALESGILGAVAQLGERCVRNAEVEGSTPFRSSFWFWAFFFWLCRYKLGKSATRLESGRRTVRIVSNLRANCPLTADHIEHRSFVRVACRLTVPRLEQREIIVITEGH